MRSAPAATAYASLCEAFQSTATEFAGDVALRLALPDPSPATLARDPQVLSLIGDAVAAANRQLSRVEQIKRFTVLSDDWQPGSDVLTPTLKLKRKPIAARYAQTVDAMYAKEHTR